MLVEANLHPFAILPPVMSTLIKNLYCLKPGQLPIFLVTDVQVLGGSCFSNVRSEAGMSLDKTCEVCKTFCRILLKRGILLHTYSCL